MVAPAVVAYDVLQNFVLFLLPAGLWLVLYLAAWSDDGVARAGGFGRGVFWVLLPGCLIGSLANLPFFQWGPDVLAVNIGGGLIPVVLSAVLLYRTTGVAARTTTVFLASFAAQSLCWLGAVEAGRALANAAVLPAVFLVIAAVPPAVFWVLSSRSAMPGSSEWGHATLLSALTSGVVLVTFATTETVPGEGILSSFPEYLVAPIVAGLIAVVWCAQSRARAPTRGLPVAYAAGTFGVLIGADLLRQPPLYAGSTPALYAIGGAGVLDLLYLSGLLAVTVAYLTARAVLRERGALPLRAPVSAADDAPPVPLLREAWNRVHRGDSKEAVALCDRAVRGAATEAREMLGHSATGRSTWSDLPVPIWAMQDSENLHALARQPSVDPRDGYRAWVTARGLVRVALGMAQGRFASWGVRAKAFALDLLVVTLPSIAALAIVIAITPGTVEELTNGVALNAVALGIAAYGFLYFTLAEGLLGRTVGKLYFGLEVRSRRLYRVGTLPVVMRNVPKLIPLTALGIGLAEIMVLALRGGSPLSPEGSVPVLEYTLDAVYVGIATVVVILLAGAASVVLITRSIENQRFGDYLAGTWVVHERPAVSAVPAPPPGVWTPPAG